MKQKGNIHFDFNKFLSSIKLRKQYIKELKKKIILLNNTKDKEYKNLSSTLVSNTKFSPIDEHLVMYIIDITFTRTNTLLHVTDFSGKLKFFCSAGSLKYTGKGKKLRSVVFRDFYRVLVSKLKFLRSKPIALHLKNVGYNKFWIIKKLKKKFFIKVIRSFNLYPHNGCRKRKMRRKKFKKKKWLSGLKRQTVNLLSYLIAGSNPAFFILLLISKYNAVVACLLWEQEAMCSNHIISKPFNKGLRFKISF
uniref:Ribosomal protein S11 n=1 Tax=Berkeleya fennica TaxID=1577906 RepID=A0A0U1XYL8_BERFE|nr:ribosomal protein S11 [Berkeleya fennica]AJA05817.1 ribosomal protein S11 [Berkeleya fennica]